MTKIPFRDLRSEIAAILETITTPITLLDLSKRLRIKSNEVEYDYLKQVLDEMQQRSMLIALPRRRYQRATQAPPQGITGTLIYQHNSAVVETHNPESPFILVHRHHMFTALHGDVVRVQLHAKAGSKKQRGEITEIVQRNVQSIAGVLDFDGTFFYVIPDDPRFHVDFLVSHEQLLGGKVGNKVVAEFVQWTHPNASPEAKIVEVIGTGGSAVVEFAAIRKEFKLPTAFPTAVEQEAMMAAPPSMEAANSRVDIRHELVVTIDPVDAKDFDDALSITTLANGNIELGVHIADVTHYVAEQSALDAEAIVRGNSTYLVDGVVPMLPEVLSNNLCSLVPNEIRYAYSVWMEFTADGTRISHRIAESVIESKRRFSYEEVQEILEQGHGEHYSTLAALRALADTLYANRMEGGGIDFETQEIKFLLNDEKMPIGALVKKRTIATSLVEECMLAANKAVAEHVQQLQQQWGIPALPLVYRVHEQPEHDKLQSAVSVIRALGFTVPNGKLGPREINAALKQAQNTPEFAVVNTLLLRAMAKAVYSEINIGHFGLGFQNYAHFTSPIRRYPDVFVHRMVKEFSRGKPSSQRLQQLMVQAETLANHTSQTERLSIEAERASVKLTQVIIAQGQIGQHLSGVVSGITTFGVFVTIPELMIEGLLHIRDLTDDYYVFDEKKFRLIGKRSKNIYQYGTEVRVFIVKANVHKRTIDLHLAPVQ
jgi:ribonuclease R